MKDFEKLTKTCLNLAASEISFSINSKMYPKDVILKTCYAMIDRIFIFLDSPCEDRIDVCLKAKEKVGRRQLAKMRDEFLNELVNTAVRKMVSRKNQKIVAHIVGGAINAALARDNEGVGGYRNNEDEDIEKIEKEIAALRKELENDNEGTYEKDSLGIKEPLLNDDNNKI